MGVCLNERAVDNGKILYVIWWWNGKKFVTLLYRFGVAPIRKRAMKRESGENPEQTELLYASTFNPIACSLPFKGWEGRRANGGSESEDLPNLD